MIRKGFRRKIDSYSALDARRECFEAVLLEDACRAIDLEGSLAAAKSRMAEAGVVFSKSAAAL